MLQRPAVVVSCCVALLTGTAMLAARAQDRQRPIQGTERPGQLTKGEVWIENRGRHEAIPIAAPDPIQVVVRNPVRQWDYQILTIRPDTAAMDLTRMLTASGIAGWETAGVQLPSGSNTLLVMKRPRPGPEPRPEPRRW